MKQQRTPPPPKGFCDPRRLAGLGEDAPLAVALSGGADSVALLAMLAPTGHVSAIHVHHGIRGKEADRDADFCRRLAAMLGIPFTLLCVDAPAIARARGVSLETAARDARYAALTEHLEKNNIRLLVTAHHADDQLETLLQHLCRGSGLRGLCGIPATRALSKQVTLVRPLLSLSREELGEYLLETGLPHITDSTNTEPVCTRNRLRLSVIPALSEMWPRAAQRAAECATILSQDEQFLQSLAANFLQKEGDQPAVAALCALPRPIFARVMQQLLPTPPESVHIEALWELCCKQAPHKGISLPCCRVAVHGGRLTVEAARDPGPVSYEIEPEAGETALPEIGGLAVLVSDTENCAYQTKNVYKYSTRISFPSVMIKGKLMLRPRRAGDVILHGGMHKAVRKLPALAKLPPAVRARMPLVCDGDGVLAVPFADTVRDSGKAKKDTTLYLFFN